MARKGRAFELAYEWLYNLDKSKYKVTSPAKLYDTIGEIFREVDVLVEFVDKENINRRLAIECRDRNNNEDVMWIEQLQQKKEDLGIDYILATTTKSFTKSAMIKAKKHGVIIERTEMFNIESIQNLSNEFFYDVFFFKFAFEELEFYLKGKGKINFKDLIKTINLADQLSLIAELNKGYYYSLEPYTILESLNIQSETFFDNVKDNSIVIDNSVVFNNNAPDIYLKHNIVMMKSKIKIIPFRLSLPLNKSLSVFEAEDKKNKKYCAVFGNDNDYVELGYIDNKAYSKIYFNKRPYLRLAGGTMHINTVFPELKEEVDINWDDVANNLLGEFDFSKIS